MMTNSQKLIVLFWVFIGGMLFWQFYSYDNGVVAQAIAHPKPEHYFFDGPSGSGSGGGIPAANVQQISFSAQRDIPSVGNLTAHITLKNIGNAKATGVQVMVQPYRGGFAYAQDPWTADSPPIRTIRDQEPLGQFGKWVTFSDLAPGQESTQDVVFSTQPAASPGSNPHPQILFETDKSNP